MRSWLHDLLGDSGKLGARFLGKCRLPRSLVLLPIVVVISGSAMATSEVNKLIAHVGVQGSTAYVTFAVAPSAVCNYNNIYLDLTTDGGKASYSLLLTANASSLPVSRVDYTKAADGTCTLSLVEM